MSIWADDETRGRVATKELAWWMRDQGYAAAAISYSGGGDEGSVEQILFTKTPLDIDAIREHSIRKDGAVDWVDSPIRYSVERWDNEKREYVTPANVTAEMRAEVDITHWAQSIVSAKWGSFAGEYQVYGTCYVDASGRIKRVDEVEYPTATYESNDY